MFQNNLYLYDPSDESDRSEGGWGYQFNSAILETPT